MSTMYSSTNRIKFTDIPEKYAVPRAYKAKACDVHSAVVTYVFDHYENTRKYRQKVVDAINRLTYCIVQSCPPPFDWNPADPLNTMPEDIDIDEVEKGLGQLFLTEDAITWDVTPAVMNEATPAVEESKPTITNTFRPIQSSSNEEVTKPVIASRPLKEIREQQKAEIGVVATSTPKEDLYIQPPKYPRFDVSKVWLSQMDGGDKLMIYTTIPEIPTKQNEISITTNVDNMTDNELYNLYPKQFIRTRSAKMYERIDGVTYDDELGLIIPIEGFTEQEVVDNIICYPHLYKLKKIDSYGKLVNFYTSIEIDGELLPISEVWDTLPESKVLPKDSEFAKEYVVRRYLLEESHGIDHKYKLFGTLDPFLTLFMPPQGYIKRGYKDSLSIVKQCVKSRVRYKQSRNPILRRLNINV